MDLGLIFSELNNNCEYRFHLAKQEPGGTRPIDVLARSHQEWAGWQVYRGTKKERFVKDKIVSFAQISGSKFLLKKIFNSKKYFVQDHLQPLLQFFKIL